MLLLLLITKDPQTPSSSREFNQLVEICVGLQMIQWRVPRVTATQTRVKRVQLWCRKESCRCSTGGGISPGYARSRAHTAPVLWTEAFAVRWVGIEGLQQRRNSLFACLSRESCTVSWIFISFSFFSCHTSAEGLNICMSYRCCLVFRKADGHCAARCWIDSVTHFL